jgi:hypothetical protein
MRVALAAWTASARAYHWKAVKVAAGWGGSLYLATRHFTGWYMVNGSICLQRTWRLRSATPMAASWFVASTATATTSAPLIA